MFFFFDEIPTLPLFDKILIDPKVKESERERMNIALQKRAKIVFVSKFPTDISEPFFRELTDSLNASIDIMEVGVKQKVNFNEIHYKGFLNNSGKIISVGNTPESITTCDYIFLRYALVFSLMKYLSSKVELICSNPKNLSDNEESLKEVIGLLKLATSKFYKLVKHKHLLFPKLKVEDNISELNPHTLQYIELVFRVNFASLLIVNAMSKPLDGPKVIFLSQLTKSIYIILLEIQPYFRSQKHEIFYLIADFCEIALGWYQLMCLFSLLKSHSLSLMGAIQKKKNHHQIIYESAMLATEIQNIVAEFSTKTFKSRHFFVIDHNRSQIQKFFEAFMRSECQEALKSYELLKGDLQNISKCGPKTLMNEIKFEKDYLLTIFEEN